MILPHFVFAAQQNTPPDSFYGNGRGCTLGFYFANSTERVSRMTLTLI